MTQDEALTILKMGKNVFLTGPAGSGKTHVLKAYIQWQRERGIQPAITASTGIAATHIRGQTIHSFSGIGIKDHLTEYDLDRMTQNEKLVKRMQKTQILIIDEVSMLSAQTLSMVHDVIQATLHTHEPFGGMQVVLCGDFFQLPPIVRGTNTITFAFESTVWNELRLHACYLNEQHRQNDKTLLSLLNNIRDNCVTEEQKRLLRERIVETPPKDVPHLYTHNVDVDALNTRELDELSGHPRFFTMTSTGSKRRVETLMRGLLVPEKLALKKGAVVMFVKNDPQGAYANGTLGKVTGYKYGYPVVKTNTGKQITVEPATWSVIENEKTVAEVTQTPLRLAWALTIHKSQGVTLDSAFIDLSKTFVEGQGYVALSRVRNLKGLYLKGIHERVYAQHPKVAHADAVFKQGSQKLVRRLSITQASRIADVSKKFLESIGAHAPRPLEDIQKEARESTYEKTKKLVRKKKPLKNIAKERDITIETVLTHIEKLLETKQLTQKNIKYVYRESDLTQADMKRIENVFTKNDDWKLAPVRRALKNKYSYRKLRIARLFIKKY
jgi:hypothetical protein